LSLRVISKQMMTTANGKHSYRIFTQIKMRADTAE